MASCFDVFSRVDPGASNIALLWKFKAPPRVLAFCWIALLGGTLTIDNLRRGKLCIVNACPMCLADEEIVEHLILNGRVARFLWKFVFSWFNASRVLPFNLVHLFEAWNLVVGSCRGHIMWRSSFVATLWVI